MSRKLSYAIWVVSSQRIDVNLNVELWFISIKTGCEAKERIIKNDIVMKANGTTDILLGEVDSVNREPLVLAIRIWVAVKQVSRDADWPQPLKYQTFEHREPQLSHFEDRIQITARRPLKGLALKERFGVPFSENALDVIPEDEQTITAKCLKDSREPIS